MSTPEKTPGRPYPKGTEVERHRTIAGKVVGYDDDLLLPLIEWEDDPEHPEACEAHEFTVPGMAEEDEFEAADDRRPSRPVRAEPPPPPTEKRRADQLEEGDRCVGPGFGETGLVATAEDQGSEVLIQFTAGTRIKRPADYELDVIA